MIYLIVPTDKKLILLFYVSDVDKASLRALVGSGIELLLFSLILKGHLSSFHSRLLSFVKLLRACQMQNIIQFLYEADFYCTTLKTCHNKFPAFYTAQ